MVVPLELVLAAAVDVVAIVAEEVAVDAVLLAGGLELFIITHRKHKES